MKRLLPFCIPLAAVFFFLADVSAAQYGPTPFSQVDILRVAPDEAAGFVPIRMPRSNVKPTETVVSRQGEWEEVRLRYRFKYNGSTDPNVCEMSLFDETFTGFRKTPPQRNEKLVAEEAKARNGDVASQVNVGDHYYARGRFAEALQWYRLAAGKGQYDARRRIAHMYIEGEGTAKDILKGYVLLRKILNQYTLYPESQASTEKYVEELAQRLSPEQREQAEKRIREPWAF